MANRQAAQGSSAGVVRGDQRHLGARQSFYRALNGLLEEHGFDEFAEEQCAEFYSGNRGRPGVPPGVYFRMLMVGYLEGLGSERGIAWRCADSFSLSEFLGCGLTGNPPEHSTLSKTRKRLSVEAHGAVFGFVLERLRESGLLSGRTLGVDATTLEANAAIRTIVRRDDGTEYEEWLEQLAAASGIEAPTREDLAKLDRKRPWKGSNKDWEHPLADRRHTEVTERRTKTDWAHFVRDIAARYPGATRITLVMDNLNTHRPGALYEAFDPAEAKALWDRFEFVYTPTHGSWLNVAEVEVNVMIRQCLNRRIDSIDTLRAEVAAWQAARDRIRAKVDWQFTTDDARVRLKRLYPTCDVT